MTIPVLWGPPAAIRCEDSGSRGMRLGLRGELCTDIGSVFGDDLVLSPHHVLATEHCPEVLAGFEAATASAALIYHGRVPFRGGDRLGAFWNLRLLTDNCNPLKLAIADISGLVIQEVSKLHQYQK